MQRKAQHRLALCREPGSAENVVSHGAQSPAQLAPPPPPPTSFASNTNSNGGSSSAASSTLNQLESSILSSIGDVFTYQPSGGGAIESAASVGPPTTALTVKNGESL